MSTKSFKVRPGPARGNDGPFQAVIADQFLKDFGGNQTSAWVVGTRTGTSSANKKHVPVLLWRETSQRGQQAQTSVGRVILLSDVARQMAGVSLGDEVQLVQDGEEPKEADEIILSEHERKKAPEVDTSLYKVPSDDMIEEAKRVLVENRFAVCGQLIDIKLMPGYPLEVIQINGSREGCLYRVSKTSEIDFVPRTRLQKDEIPRNRVYGLDNILERLNLISILRNDDDVASSELYIRFVLLTGQVGCGKSTVLEAVALVSWQKVFVLDINADWESRMATIFAQASQLQSALILIDNFRNAKSHRHEGHDLITTLSMHKSRLYKSRTARIMLLAAARSPEDITPDLFDETLRAGVPNLQTREAYLRTRMQCVPHDEGTIESLARQTPAFTIADLQNLVEWSLIDWRGKLTKDAETWLASIGEGLKHVSPTVMHGLHIKVPETRFSDIGGQMDVKAFLEKTLRRALEDTPTTSRMNRLPAKGLLMYGPPGCSKTLIAKAVATEFGINFLLVNAAELINSFVGESERQVRELFRRARDASPCVIFFDEFEALGGRRSHAHQSLNVVQTLLTEMDGVKSLDRVFMLAATNLPQMLEPALLRPGRLNPHIMVGPPDQHEIREIMKIRLRNVDTRLISDDIDLDAYVKCCDGQSGAGVIAYIERAMTARDDEAYEHSSPQTVRLSHKHFEMARTGLAGRISEAQMEHYREWASEIELRARG